MKYIRTKDGIYKVENGFIQLNNQELFLEHFKDHVIKQADTINELCDEFVFHTLDGYEQHFVSQGHLEDVLNNKNINLKDYLSCREIYGAIWTDKGLIYVAKMNEKGELELL